MRAGFASSATKSYRRVFEKRSGALKASEQLFKSFKVPPRKSWINQARPWGATEAEGQSGQQSQPLIVQNGYTRAIWESIRIG